MCVNYYSYLTTNQADSQPGWAISLNYLNNI